MSIPPVPSDPRGTAHFTEKTKICACQCYFDAYYEIYKVRLDHCPLPKLVTGRRGDPVISKAYESFMAVGTVDGVVIGEQRGCTRKAYIKLLHRYWPEYAATRSCPPPTRKKAINLTVAEGKELAKLVATPVKDASGSYSCWSCLADAKEKLPRVKALVDKAGATDRVLHDWLLDIEPDLRFGCQDTAFRLAPTTLKKRRECAEKWRGDACWFERVPPFKTRRVSKPEGCSTMQPVTWDPAWFGQHTFMLDATHFCNKDASMKDPDITTKVYSMRGEVYPPRLVDAPKPISQATSIMVYTVIHKELGLVLGPDIMFTGTKLPMPRKRRGQAAEEAAFAAAGVETWYGS